MSKRRMDAYYYGFDATGSETIDKILGAVACAGKSSHHTENWDEEACVYDDHTGKTPTEWIQNAAMEAADEVARQHAENERLREALASSKSWIDRWTKHVGNCSGSDETCTCGRAAILFEASAALAEQGEKS